MKNHFLMLPDFSRRLVLTLTLSSALGAPFFARAAPLAKPHSKTAKRAPSRPISRSESYILGAGDMLRVVVSGYPEFNQEAVVIPPDGTVTLPDFGTLRLSGKTRLAVQRELGAALKRATGMRAPALALSITQFRSQVVGNLILSGDVPRSGSFQVREGQRLSDLLAEAGLQSRLEERRATLTRRGSRQALNLRAAAATPRGAFDLALRAGDSISVKQLKPGRITLLGDLPRAGVYELHLAPQNEMMELGLQPRLSDLITRAGGLRSDSATLLATLGSATGAVAEGQGLSAASALLSGASKPASYRGFLQRGGKRVALDPEAALANVGGSADIRLKNGDFVTLETVPAPVPLTVYLDGVPEGLATRTGSFPIPQGTGVLELLTIAGGLTRAPGQIVASVRRGAQILPLDLTALLLSSQSGANLTLQNGDILQLREPASIEIQVAGKVAKPGPLRLKPGATLLEALLAAGGLSLPAEEVRLSVLRKESDGNQRVLQADAAGIVTLRDVSTNFALQNGDLVNIAQNATQTVLVSGQVASPGPIQLRAGEGLAELLVRAGGATPDAALTRVRVTRAGKIIEVDAFDAVKSGKPLDFAVQDGDLVLIPQNIDRVLVMEAVAKPGYYPIPERGRLMLLDVLAQALPQAGTKTVIITRAKADGTIDTQSQPQPIKLEDLRRGTTPNLALSPRDIVFVPSPKTKRSLLGALSTFSTLRFLFP